MPRTAGKTKGKTASSTKSTTQCRVLFVASIGLSEPLIELPEAVGIAQDVREELSGIKAASEPLLVRVLWSGSFTRKALLGSLAGVREELENIAAFPQEGLAVLESGGGVVVERLNLLSLLELGYSPAMGQLHDDKTVKDETLADLSTPQAFEGIASVEAVLDALRDKLKPDLQRHLDSVVASNAENRELFPRVEEKQHFVRSLNTLLDRLGFAVADDEGQPARLNAYTAGGMRGGAFRFSYPGRKGTTNYPVLPPLPLVPKPEHKGRKTLS